MKLCSFNGCCHKVDQQGLCEKHYQEKWEADRETRIATKNKRAHPDYMIWFERKQANALCVEWLDFEAFLTGIGKRQGPRFFLVRPKNEPYGPNNFQWVEKLKRRDGETLKQWHARKWASRRRNFPSYESDRLLRRKYGITTEQYNAMLDEQNSVCAVCKNEETTFDSKTGSIRKLAVDHCHKTNRVRALLCFRCNSVIGKIEESQEILSAISDYLRKHQTDKPKRKNASTAPRYPSAASAVAAERSEPLSGLSV